MISFDNESAARAALNVGRIQAYYVLPADYRTSGKLRVVHINEIKDPASQQFLRAGDRNSAASGSCFSSRWKGG